MTRYRETEESATFVFDHAVREQLLSDLKAVEHRVNGDLARCLPHVLNVSFPGIDSEALMLALRDKLAFSNGSACTSSSYKPSHVLVAMGLSERRICNSIRISFGHTALMASPLRCIGSLLLLKFSNDILVSNE